MKSVAHQLSPQPVPARRTGGFFAATGAPGFFPAVRHTSATRVAPSLRVSQPTDPLEREADRTADAVLAMTSPPAATATTGHLQRTGTTVQRSGDGPPGGALGDPTAELGSAAAGGHALPAEVRAFMEPRLGADLAGVRVHTDARAAGLSNRLSARAFTYGRDVFFGRDQFQPATTDGRRLLAHELTHTVQQGATRQVHRSPLVSASAGQAPQVQRLGVQDVLDHLADKARFIPGFTMLTVGIGFNPVSGRPVPRTAANFLRALIQLIPGGAVITRVLDQHGVVNDAAAWVSREVAALGDIGAMAVAGLRRFLDSLSWTDIVDLGDVWERAKRVFTDPVDRLISFGRGAVGQLLALVRRAVLRPLAALAEGTAGYDLLKAVLGQDPITGDPYPRTAQTLLGGFLTLIGQQEVWANLQKGRAVPRAWAWFQGVLGGLLGFARAIPGRILGVLRALTFEDLVTVVGAFRRVAGALVGIAGEFGRWALRQVLTLLEILFSVVAPGALPYLAKARATFLTIVRNPVGFVRNLVAAGRLGFRLFAGNIVTHLRDSLITWLLGPLAEAGVYLPRSFSLLEIVKLVLSVLGLAWQNLRGKLVRIIPEPVLARLEKTAQVLVTLVREGPAAAWEQIKDELTELKGQLIEQVTALIRDQVVTAAVTKLVSMINPAGAVVQAILAIYNTIRFFIERAQQIGAVVASFVDSVSAIAAGLVTPAARRVEQTMTRTLTVVLGFLARLAGFGGIPARLVGIVQRIRTPIDRALDRIVDWLGGLLRKLAARARGDLRTMAEKQRDLRSARDAAQGVLGQPGRTPADVRARLPELMRTFKLASIALRQLPDGLFTVDVEINPREQTTPQSLQVTVQIPAGLVVGLHLKYKDQIYRVSTIDDRHVVLAHATNVKAVVRFATHVFVANFLAGKHYVRATDSELAPLLAVDPHWVAKIVGRPQTTGTPGHPELMAQTAERFAKMLSVKRVHLDRAYHTITIHLRNSMVRLRRADVVVEHHSGRLDVIEIRSRTDAEEQLLARNQEALDELPKDLAGAVQVVPIPGVTYRGRRTS